MKIFHTIKEVKDYISLQRNGEKSIGFIPTMGALHEGHIELVKRSKKENDFTVASIFVNPIQFNNPDDLARYPRTLETDQKQLEAAGCDLVFVPSAEEMYPEPDNTQFDFGHLDKVMEGKFRPGHFRGVGVVVKKLFEIILPHRAYFGEKDFQQLAIIKYMVKSHAMLVDIVPCPTVREPDGLAMSSRNRRLLPEQRAAAPIIYETLRNTLETYNWFTPEGVNSLVTTGIETSPHLRVEYAQVVDADTLLPFDDWQDVVHAVICVAVFAGDVRLIDNLRLY